MFSDANLNFRLHVSISLVCTAHKTAQGHSQTYPYPKQQIIFKKLIGFKLIFKKCGEAQLQSYLYQNAHLHFEHILL